MRHPRLALTALAVSGLLVLGVAIATPGLAQKPAAPAPAPQADAPAQDQPAPPKAYKPVAITMPATVDDPTFAAFRKQLAAVAASKDMTALGKMVVARGFFWQRDDSGDSAEKGRSGIGNLSRVIGLQAADGSGWDILTSYAEDDSATPMTDRKGVVCAPADPTYDEKAFEALLDATATDPYEWGFPFADDVDIRSGPKADSPVMAKLGLNLVRIYPDENQTDASPAPESLRVVAPSGKLGYVPIDAIAAFGNDQMCYAKEAGGWKITGYVGTGNPQ